MHSVRQHAKQQKNEKKQWLQEQKIYGKIDKGK